VPQRDCLSWLTAEVAGKYEAGGLIDDVLFEKTARQLLEGVVRALRAFIASSLDDASIHDSSPIAEE